MRANTENLVYISSWDEATWTLDFNQRYYINKVSIKWNDRAEVRSWINQCCQDCVYIWNGVVPSSEGDTRRLTPDSEKCYIMFINDEDQTMFFLKYAKRFKIINFNNNLEKAFRDSRS